MEPAFYSIHMKFFLEAILLSVIKILLKRTTDGGISTAMTNAVDITVTHDKDQQQFSHTVDGHTSYIKYSMVNDNEIDFYSTFTHPVMRGQGIASQLTTVALKFANNQGYKIHASCWYVAKFLKDMQK